MSNDEKQKGFLKDFDAVEGGIIDAKNSVDAIPAPSSHVPSGDSPPSPPASSYTDPLSGIVQTDWMFFSYPGGFDSQGHFIPAHDAFEVREVDGNGFPQGDSDHFIGRLFFLKEGHEFPNFFWSGFKTRPEQNPDWRIESETGEACTANAQVFPSLTQFSTDVAAWIQAHPEPTIDNSATVESINAAVAKVAAALVLWRDNARRWEYSAGRKPKRFGA